ncbi:MAG: PEGA domain-containing protein, partial [Fibromonadaceae bacterium]|nr:PEGA domain-containing protein [Fibromonadaceae bacterium]
KLGSKENANKVCKEAQCLAVIGRKVSAAYVGQARVGRFDNKLTIFMELYNSASGTLVSSFTGEARDLSGLLDVLDKKAPEMFGKLPGVSSVKSQSSSVEGGISGLQKATSYETDEEKQYVVNLSTEPSGAFMSFDGVPATSCPKTPCKAELAGGNVRIVAALEQYERADTTVLIKQNRQNISIKLKPSFGVLEIKPAYLESIGSDKPWDLSINGKLYSLLYSLGEINLSPNKYSVKLSHECYEDIDFNAGINKGSREVFDMSGYITLKKGGLALSAERNGEPVSEPVFVNDKQVGETPFSGSVPLCAKIEIGSGRELVDVKLKYKEKVKHTHRLESAPNPDQDPVFAPIPTPAPEPKQVPESESDSDLVGLYYNLSFYIPSITSFYEYKNQELKWNGLTVIFGADAIVENNNSFGLFFGLGGFGESSGLMKTGIQEILAGADAKKLFWLSRRAAMRIAIPVSLGLVWRGQFADIENRLVAEFINEPKFLQESEDYLNGSRNMFKHNIDLMPAVDLQVFIGKLSLYVGYMYRATLSSDWGFEYKILGKYYDKDDWGNHYSVPDKYDPLKNSKEEVFGIPGTFRFGIKYKAE